MNNSMQMTKLKKLQLNFSFNNISSDGFVLIIKDICQTITKQIEKINLILQSIKTNPIHFNKAMKNFLVLTEIKQFKLNVSGNSIRDEGMFSIGNIINRLQKLNKCELILRNCQIQDKGFTQFIKELSQRALTLQDIKLNLLSNQLTQKGAKSFSSYFEPLTNLKNLDINLSNNPNFNDNAIRLLAKSLLIIKSMIKLRLLFDSIDLTQKGCLYLGRLISQQLLLEQVQLSLKHDPIGLQGIQYICAGLMKVKRIRKLRICFEATNIGDESANYLAMTLLKMRHLTNVELNLDNCDLTAQTVQNIIKTVKQCSKKTEQITINLRKNQQLKLQLYQQIKKDLKGSRIAIRLDNPSQKWNGSQIDSPLLGSGLDSPLLKKRENKGSRKGSQSFSKKSEQSIVDLQQSMKKIEE